MNVVMLWLRVAAWLVVWLVVRDWVAAREGLGHRRCAGWLGGRAEFLVEAIVAVLDGWEKG